MKQWKTEDGETRALSMDRGDLAGCLDTLKMSGRLTVDHIVALRLCGIHGGNDLGSLLQHPRCMAEKIEEVLGQDLEVLA